ncbi:MAG TPA: fluoride efflux transporter CrcB [Marmoricola sp.]
MTALVWVGVGLCGGLGAVLRLLVDTSISRRRPGPFPYGTFVINVSGAFILGLLDGIVLPKDAALIVGTGVIGAYTTFSTWMFETQRLGEERRSTVALANVGISTAAGIAAAALGLWLGGL